jgi:hypothetical protein
MSVDLSGNAVKHAYHRSIAAAHSRNPLKLLPQPISGMTVL